MPFTIRTECREPGFGPSLFRPELPGSRRSLASCPLKQAATRGAASPGLPPSALRAGSLATAPPTPAPPAPCPPAAGGPTPAPYPVSIRTVCRAPGFGPSQPATGDEPVCPAIGNPCGEPSYGPPLQVPIATTLAGAQGVGATG